MIHSTLREKIVPILSYGSGTASRSASVIDTVGFKAFKVVVHHAAIGAGATYSVKLQGADAASDSTTLTSGADIAGTSQTVAADDDNEVTIIDVVDPPLKFYQLVVSKDGANTCAESAVAYLYYSDSAEPVTHATGSGTSGGSAAVNNVERHVHPVAGTA